MIMAVLSVTLGLDQPAHPSFEAVKYCTRKNFKVKEESRSTFLLQVKKPHNT
jgi:hypothetical protein